MLPDNMKKKGYFDKIVGNIRAQFLATHIAKGMETNCEFIAINDESRAEGEKYLCTATCGSHRLDLACKNAADSRAQSFLLTEIEGKTIYQLIVEDDDALRRELEDCTADYEKIRSAVMAMNRAKATQTNQLVKQVYFPVEDGYHLLSILPSSVLVDKVGSTVRKSHISHMTSYCLTSNAASTTGSYLLKKNRSPSQFCSLPPSFLRKSLARAMKKEYLLPDFQIDEMAGFEQGKLVETEKLELIIQEGIRKGSGNWRKLADRAERSLETIQAFLSKYGYDSIPLGYELHHIVPIAQGGADDVNNLVLLTVDDHRIVTDKHSEVFKWNI